MKIFRNWLEICKIKDYFLRLTLSSINLSYDEGKLLAIVFPDCFSDSICLGPVPWSAIRRKGKALYSTRGIPNEIPVFMFGDDNTLKQNFD